MLYGQVAYRVLELLNVNTDSLSTQRSNWCPGKHNKHATALISTVIVNQDIKKNCCVVDISRIFQLFSAAKTDILTGKWDWNRESFVSTVSQLLRLRDVSVKLSTRPLSGWGGGKGFLFTYVYLTDTPGRHNIFHSVHHSDRNRICFSNSLQFLETFIQALDIYSNTNS